MFYKFPFCKKNNLKTFYYCFLNLQSVKKQFSIKIGKYAEIWTASMSCDQHDRKSLSPFHMLLRIFHFPFCHSHGRFITRKTKNLRKEGKGREGGRERRRRETGRGRERDSGWFSTYLPRFLWLIRKFCLRFTNDLNIFVTQETKHWKSLWIGWNNSHNVRYLTLCCSYWGCN